MKYNKLVRDKIPHIIEEKGLVPITYIADDEEYWNSLKNKLIEEVEEFLEETNIWEELADVIEVIYAILAFKWISLEDLEQIRLNKKEERGWFENKIILKETKNN